MGALPLDPQFGLPYWLDFERPHFPPLAKDVSADVAIVGGGIAGLKLAHYLARHQVSSVVLEGSRVGEGASGRNQGSINCNAALSYPDSIAKYSHETARLLWQLGLENQRLIEEQIREYEIDCSYAVLGYTTLVRKDFPGVEPQLAALRAEYELLMKDGFAVSLLTESDVPHPDLFAGGLCYDSDSQFHSGKYVAGIATGLARSRHIAIHEGSRVHDIRLEGTGVRLVTSGGTVSSGQAFVMTNALAPQFVRALEPGIRAERGQVFVTEPLAERPCRGSFGTALAWWREIPEPDGRYRLLFGGGRTRDEPDSLFRQFDDAGQSHPQLETEGFRPSAAHQARLDEQFAKIFPKLAGARITHRWGGLQAFTGDSLPLVGEFDPARRIHGLAGFCGRGNAHSDVGARYLAAQVAGADNEFRARFGCLFEQLMQPRRAAAHWPPWTGSND